MSLGVISPGLVAVLTLVLPAALLFQGALASSHQSLCISAYFDMPAGREGAALLALTPS